MFDHIYHPNTQNARQAAICPIIYIQKMNRPIVSGSINRQSQPLANNNLPSNIPPATKVGSNAQNTVAHPKPYALDDKQDDLPVAAPLAKLTALARKQYLNPLARLEYEDREMEVYTKLTKQSQKTVQKKLKAKNQLADFRDEDFDQEREIDDLLQFKFGKKQPGQPENVYFQKDDEDDPRIDRASTQRNSKFVRNIEEDEDSPRLKLKQSEPTVQRSGYFVPQPITSPPLVQQPVMAQSNSQYKPATGNQAPPLSASSRIVPQQLVYCNSCQSFMTESEAQLHCKNCFFDYSQNWTVRKEQIISKLEKIYQNLAVLPETSNIEVIRNILVDVTYLESTRKTEEYLAQVRNIKPLTDMEALLQRRIIVCLEEKAALRTHIGPRLNIFAKNKT